MLLQEPLTFISAILISYFIPKNNRLFHLFLALISLAIVFYIDSSSILVIILGLFLMCSVTRGMHVTKVVFLCISILLFYKTGIHLKIAHFFNINLIDFMLVGEASHDRIIPSGSSFFLLTICMLSLNLRKANKLTESISAATFFPHILAGPILYKPLKKQARLSNISPGYSAILYCLGMYLLFASGILGEIFDQTLGSQTINGYFRSWIYYLYLFSNFFGYSLLASAYALLFGVEIPINFNAPLLAKNPSNFWIRWHRSLSLLFRNYLFKELLKRKTHYILAVIFVMSISGLWHGWGWNFLIWGLLNGILIIMFKEIKNTKVESALTFLVMPAMWVPFFSSNFDETIKHYQDFLSFDIPLGLFSAKLYLITFSVILLGIVSYKKLLSLFFEIRLNNSDPYGSHTPIHLSRNRSLNEFTISIIGAGLLALIAFYGIGSSTDFFYQKF
jgi:alginate O-acetyltransferase complex protein AlgI